MYSCVIPARFASTRLPGKPLRDMAGQTMIERVYRAASNSAAERVIVATDDERIAEVVRAFGGEVVMTSTEHRSGTDRLAEVAELCGFNDDDVLVNVQGDEPLMPASVIEQVAANLVEHPDCGVATLCEAIQSYADFTDPNIVKVVADTQGHALYFSRAPIPWPRDAMSVGEATLVSSSVFPSPTFPPPMRHIGLYAYRVQALRAFTQLSVATLEAAEALEQLRFLANGVPVHVAAACAEVPGGVDTEADLQRVCALLLEDGQP
ncbi:MAG: 3-deoxy-manno-octulosonate cytidylyltransferase [Porticoccaceae bacterium]|nr:3-deoxy-manno-octulosonate cytidylyltransferase [Porticoccaceae bacterium]